MKKLKISTTLEPRAANPSLSSSPLFNHLFLRLVYGLLTEGCLHWLYETCVARWQDEVIEQRHIQVVTVEASEKRRVLCWFLTPTLDGYCKKRTQGYSSLDWKQLTEKSMVVLFQVFFNKTRCNFVSCKPIWDKISRTQKRVTKDGTMASTQHEFY